MTNGCITVIYDKMRFSQAVKLGVLYNVLKINILPPPIAKICKNISDLE